MPILRAYEAGRIENRELMTPMQRSYTTLNHDQQSVFWSRHAIQKEKLVWNWMLQPER
jgi:hypothetical protein